MNRIKDLLQSIWPVEFHNAGLRKEHFSQFSIPENESNPSSYHDLAKFLFAKKISPEVVMQEINGLSFFQAHVLREFYDRGLRGDDLRAWKAAGEFTFLREYAYSWLVQEKNVNPKAAMKALDGLADEGDLDKLELKAYEQYQKNESDNRAEEDKKLFALFKSKMLQKYKDAGLREEHFSKFNIHDEISNTHYLYSYEELAKKLFGKKLPPEVVMSEISGLYHYQALLLRDYYEQGLRGDDLRVWKAPGGFSSNHYSAFRWLVDEKGVDIKSAVRALDGLSRHVSDDELKKQALEQYQKTLPETKIQPEKPITGFAGLKSKWLQKYKDAGLREEHFNGFVPHRDMDNPDRSNDYDDLAKFLFAKKISPQNAIDQINGLSYAQAQVLQRYYDIGLRQGGALT